MSLTLYTYPGNYRAFKALIAAEYAGVAIHVPPFNFGVDNKTPEFLSKNPLGKVPVLETPEGSIFESNAIARYVARIRADLRLYGGSFIESAQIDSWVDWCSNELEVAIAPWLYPVLGFMPRNDKAASKAKADTKKALAVLEQRLFSRTFIVGERVSLADIVIVSTLLYPFKFVFDANFRKEFPCVQRWFTTCVHQPQFEAIVGEVPLCTKEVEPAAPAKAAAPAAAAAASAAAAPAAGGAAAGGKKGGKKGGKGGDDAAAAPAAAAPAPAAASASASAAAADDAAAEEDDEPKQAKPKHPLDLLPRSSFVMDAWKKAYSNSKKDYYASMPTFWETYDPEGYSLWTCRYNFNEENTVLFKVCNMTGGFLQRTDELRKYAFGTMVVLETPGAEHFEVVGCWLLRGQDYKVMLDENPDAEYYTWTRITDLTDEGKKLVGDYWCAGETLLGRTIADSKVFK